MVHEKRENIWNRAFAYELSPVIISFYDSYVLFFLINFQKDRMISSNPDKNIFRKSEGNHKKTSK